MSFLNPIWLWGLTGLAIPIGIHMLSRKEGKVIRVGSVRYLQESASAQFSSLRLNEIVLLVLRCFILACVVFFLAGLNLNINTRNKWLLLEPRIEKHISKSILDSLKKAGYEKRYLQKGFPGEVISDSVINYWQLGEQLSEKDVDAIVFSYNRSENFYGKRVSKPENIQWITVEPPDTSLISVAVSLANNSVWTRKAFVHEYQTTYLTEIHSPTDIGPVSLTEPADTIRIFIHYSPTFEKDARILQACLLTLKTISPNPISIVASTKLRDANYNWMFWLSKENLPAQKENIISFVDLEDSNLPILLFRNEISKGDSRIKTRWTITSRLTEAIVIKEKLIFDIAKLILISPRQPRGSKAVLAEQMLWSRQDNGDKKLPDEKNSGIGVLLVALIFSLLLIERSLSYKRMI